MTFSLRLFLTLTSFGFLGSQKSISQGLIYCLLLFSVVKGLLELLLITSVRALVERGLPISVLKARSLDAGKLYRTAWSISDSSFKHTSDLSLLVTSFPAPVITED